MYTDECIYVYTLTLSIKMNVYMCIYIYKDWMHKNTLTKKVSYLFRIEPRN